MAERRLRELLDQVLHKTRSDGMKQSDRHVTDTLITFKDIDDILLSWYEKQYHYSMQQGQNWKNKKVKGSAAAAVKKDWNKLRSARRGAFRAYKDAVKKQLQNKGYGRQLPGRPDDLIWQFLSWQTNVTAAHAHAEINKVAMAAMADYVDTHFRQEERKLNRSSYLNNSARGTGGTKGSLASMATNFAHGRYEGQYYPGSKEVGTTTGSIGVLEDILSGSLRSQFAKANPVVDQFIDDIYDMFITDGNIQVLDTSSIGGHKNTIMIKGSVTSNRINRASMKSWDRGKAINPSIQKRIVDTMQDTFNNLLDEVKTKGSLAGFNYTDISASPTQGEIVLDKGVRKVLGEVKKVNPKAKITYAKKKVKQKKKTSAKSSNKKGKGRTKKRNTRKAPIAPIKVTGRSRARVSAATSPIGLTELLNKSLAKELMKNMGPYPRRLENRSGRFARSAEVVNIAPLPKSVEIQYTYQKDPYEVFEPDNGNPMASWGRDPRRLIGGTIRELAQSIMGTKYGIVRTKRV